MRLKEIEIPVNIDTGGTTPEIKADEHNLEITFFLDDSNERGKLKFKSLLQFTFGYPNEESISGHRYYKLGLIPFKFFEIENSEIIQKIMESNRIHPSHKDDMFSHWRHFILPLHDTTLEVIAKTYEFE